MKNLVLVAVVALMMATLATGCPRKNVDSSGLSSELEQIRQAFLNDNVHFDLDSYAIREDGAMIMQAKAMVMNKFPSMTTEIQGHCDERGSEAYNMALGDRRAKAAFNYMRSLNIDANRMTTVSYGKDRPLDPAHNEVAWAINRRAQFVTNYNFLDAVK